MFRHNTSGSIHGIGPVVMFAHIPVRSRHGLGLVMFGHIPGRLTHGRGHNPTRSRHGLGGITVGRITVGRAVVVVGGLTLRCPLLLPEIKRSLFLNLFPEPGFG
jgi:hypothetical protein